MAQHKRQLITGRLAALTQSQSVRRVTAGVIVLSLLTVPSLVAFLSTTEPIVLSSNTQGNLYSQPAQVTVKQGQTVRVAVRIEPGTPIDTVTATLEYDKEVLSYTSVSYAESPFTTQIPATTKPSQVTVQVAKFGGDAVTSDSLVAAVTFAAQKDGAASLQLTGDAARAGIATHPTANGKTVPLTAANGQGGTRAAPSTSANNTIADTSSASELSVPGGGAARTLLARFGMSDVKAKAVAPVVVITFFIATVAVGAFIFYKYRVKQRRAHTQHNSLIATGGEHEHTK